jgi:hypothetical protein
MSTFYFSPGAHSLPARVRASSRADFGALAEISLREKLVIAGASSAAPDGGCAPQSAAQIRVMGGFFPKTEKLIFFSLQLICNPRKKAPRDRTMKA